jgi:lipopolysaccharide export system permease protein
MKLNAILDRYIFLEFIPPFAINLGFFTFVFLMAEMLKLTDLIINYNVGLLVILTFLVLSTPYFLNYVIPMSIMMAVLLTFLRMSGDNEIIALKTGGVSLYRLIPPVLVFCLLGCALTFVIGNYGMPKGQRALKALTFEVFASNLDIGLKERTFNDSFNGVMLYVNKVDKKTKTLIDVFIEDKRDENAITTVIAPQGRLFSEPKKQMFQLRLYGGLINQVRLDSRSAHTISFDNYDIRLDLKQATATAKGVVGPKELGLRELIFYRQHMPRHLSMYKEVLMEFHKKFSIPFACFCLGILAVPLGVQSRSAKRSSGLVLGLSFFLFYYLLLSVGLVFGESESYPPWVGMWLPNVVTGFMGVYLLVRAARERPVHITGWLQRLPSLRTRPRRKA